MTEFTVGDLVEAVKGEAKYRARTHAGFVTGEIQLSGVGSIDRLAEDGFTLTVIEKASPPLPTEVGVYLDNEDGVWTVETTGFRAINAGMASGWFDAEHAAKFAPFTRLAPVAEVLGKVARLYEGDIAPLPSDLAIVAADYGVEL